MISDLIDSFIYRLPDNVIRKPHLEFKKGVPLRQITDVTCPLLWDPEEHVTETITFSFISSHTQVARQVAKSLKKDRFTEKG